MAIGCTRAKTIGSKSQSERRSPQQVAKERNQHDAHHIQDEPPRAICAMVTAPMLETIALGGVPTGSMSPENQQ